MIGAWCPLKSSPQKVALSNSDPQVSPYLEKRVFADVIRLRILRGDDPGLSRWALKALTSVLRRLQELCLHKGVEKTERGVA